MDRQNRKAFYRALFYVIAVVSLIINVWLFNVIIQANYENVALRDKLSMRVAELALKHKEEVDQRVYLDHFRDDEEFRKRLARDLLNYAAPNEFIFRFEGEDSQ